MMMKIIFIIIMVSFLSSCGYLIGPYLSTMPVESDIIPKLNNGYIFGKFSLTEGAEVETIVVVLRNTDKKMIEYRMNLKTEKPVYCIEVTPGNYVIEGYKYLGGLQVKNQDFLGFENFQVKNGEVMYLGDYSGHCKSSHMYIGGSFIFNYKWKLDQVTNNFDETKAKLLERYPQFKDYRFTSRFETN